MQMNESISTWIKKNFFDTPASACTSLVLGLAVLWIGWKICDWAFLSAVWTADVNACRAGEGACWGFVAEKWRLILFGRFPFEEQWRPAAATLLVMCMLVLSGLPLMWRRGRLRLLAAAWAAALAGFFLLMYGGAFGLARVGTDLWGGLPLTVIITFVGMTLSSPIGILLAIGRRSRMPIISSLSTTYIEIVRGVPLITVLFVAAFVFPLLLPSSFKTDAFWRVAVAIALFQAAYMAETVRGGLQTIPNGQYSAARSLGMTPRQVYQYVVLPQALVAIIPAFVNSLISCFMDTSLVTVVSMQDLLGSLRLALGDAQWRGFFIEGYVFISLVYFLLSYAVSCYSLWLERRLTGKKRRELPDLR